MDEVLEPPAPMFASRGGTSIKSGERMTSSSASIGGESTRRKFGTAAGFFGGRAKNQPPPDFPLVLAENLLDAEPHESEDPGSQGETLSRPAPTSTNKQSSGLFRKLTTKFNRNRAKSTSPPPANKRHSLEARNAALRERGLLPPLPLSVQEAQQDSRIAIVAPPEARQAGLERSQTAANRVKEEWEAKNRERMNGFRFGGNSASPSPMQENLPAAGLELVQEAETPLSSSGPQEAPSGFVDEPETKAPRAPPPTLNLGREHRVSPPLLQTWSNAPPDPSFLSSPAPVSATESLISAFPLPPSPASSSNPSLHSTLRGGTETSRVGDNITSRPPLSPTSASTDGSFLVPPSLSQSIPRIDGSESESSVGVPSLIDSESQTSMNVSDSLESFGRMRNVPLATKVHSSTFEPQGSAHHAISVMVECPSEDRDETLLSASPVDEELSQPKALPIPSENPRAPQRRTTEPPPPAEQAPALGRRKTLNVFKKMSLRHPTGLARSKTSAKPPALTGQRQLANGHLACAAQPHPTSVRPTMHNAGTILLETNKIEDDETRRITEMAFM